MVWPNDGPVMEAGGRVLDGILTEELIDSRVGVHDSSHVEFKLDYAHQPGRQRSRYRAEAYFFIPKSLGINPYTYSANNFYTDIQAYIRFKAPALALDALKGGDEPLLARIRELLEAARGGAATAGLHNQLVVELKLLGCIVRSNIRDQVALMRSRLEGANGILDVEATATHLISDARKATKRFRKLRGRFVDGSVPESVSRAFLNVDEFISLVVESHLTDLVHAIDGAGAGERLSEVRAAACQLIVAEAQHRAAAGYRSVVDATGSNEHFLFRRGTLKKFVTSALWLEIDRSRPGRGASQLAAAIAAGSAMAFAAVATMLSTQWYAINSWGFIAIAVVTYMFKDRIKDLLKAYFSRRMTSWLADFSVQIRDPVSQQTLGRCKEAASYLRPGDIPAKVHAARYQEAASRASDASPEEVLKYEKLIELDGERLIEHLHQERYDIHDIIRFDLGQILPRTDDPLSRVAIYDEQNDRVKMREFAKVYHLNVVLVLQADHLSQADQIVRRIRIVFNRRGILRLEEAA